MRNYSATSVACANIAFIKYWGDRDPAIRLPENGSISMNLEGMETRTKVIFDPDLMQDRLRINGNLTVGEPLMRISSFLDRLRTAAQVTWRAEVDSSNNFPMGTGIASSASAFAALACAASAALNQQLEEKELSRLARVGSGSACRSVPGGFVEWQAGESDQDSYAFSIAPPEHWNLIDHVAVISTAHKSTGSKAGHLLARSSPLQGSRVKDAPRRLAICRRAILGRDFEAFSEIVELDSNMMHAVMMTSQPVLMYWQPLTLEIMHGVGSLRQQGIPVCYTVDAGPNVHVLCLESASNQVRSWLSQIPGVTQVFSSRPAGPVRLEK
jgi:diphosphomevalonate decarboxylase